MKIRFLPQLEIPEAGHVLSGLVWKYNEVKDIPDDQKIRVKFAGSYKYVNLCEDLLSNPMYRLAETNTNPNYTCADCGIYSTAEAFSNPLTAEGVFFELDGDHLCPECYAYATNAISLEDESSDNEVTE